VCDTSATAPAQQGPRDIRWICHTAIIDGPRYRLHAGLRTQLVRTSHQSVSQLQLRRIKSCVRALSMDVRKKSTVSLSPELTTVIVCWPDWVQSVLNTAARLIVGAKKHDHIKHVLRDRLHWLPVPQRVQFKLYLLTYRALHGLAPSYIANLCRPVTSVGSRQRLQCATRGELVVRSSVTHFGWGYRMVKIS